MIDVLNELNDFCSELRKRYPLLDIDVEEAFEFDDDDKSITEAIYTVTLLPKDD